MQLLVSLDWSCKGEVQGTWDRTGNLRSYEIRVRLENHPRALEPGTYATVLKEPPKLPIKILRHDHSEIIGMGYVLLTASHSTHSDIDNAGQLVEHAALASRAYGVVGKTGSTYQDNELLLSAQTDLRESIATIIEENGIKCILNIY